MIAPLIWLIFGSIFYAAAKHRNARPWAWVGASVLSSFLVLLACAFILPMFIEDSDRWNVPALVGTGIMVAYLLGLLAYMCRRVPFRK